MIATKRLIVIVAFLLGVIVGSLLERPIDAQNAIVLYGTLNGVTTPVSVDASGNVNAIGH